MSHNPARQGELAAKADNARARYEATKSQNEGYGFHGTIADHPFIQQQIDALFKAATEAVAKYYGIPNTAARDFLDSRVGRHLADCLNSEWAFLGAEGCQDAIKGALPAFKRSYDDWKKEWLKEQAENEAEAMGSI